MTESFELNQEFKETRPVESIEHNDPNSGLITRGNVFCVLMKQEQCAS